MSADARRLQTLDQVRNFLDDDRAIPQTQSREDACRLIEHTVAHFDYARLRKADKGLVRSYLGVVTGLSRAQITRLLKQHRTTGGLSDRRGVPRRPFPRRYTNGDIELLAQVDSLHGALFARATRRLLRRAYEVFGDQRFERLAGISKGHLYNLRHSPRYLESQGATRNPIRLASRERWRPLPFPHPGHLRVVTVHRGDSGALAGLYLLELVDEVTGFHFVGSVTHLDPSELIPIVQALRRAFAFALVDFHVDRELQLGKRPVAALLQSLHTERLAGASVPQLHSAYPRATNRYVDAINVFFEQTLAHYLNYHRLLFFPSERVDARGRTRVVYRDADIMTPYERLRSLASASDCLTPGTTLAHLDAVASAMSDNEAAHAVSEARDRLFRREAKNPGER